MKLYVGTSGYSYKEWKGSFYPEKLAAGEMLRFYGERLTAVEINNTFYRMPKASVLQSWAEQVPAGFRFAIKASRAITHIKRLGGVASELAYLTRTLGELGERLGPVLFQLPPNLRADVERLAAFLGLLPPGLRAALEFRHPSWSDEGVLALLRRHEAALCNADTDEEPASAITATASWGYVRLRRAEYDDAELRTWHDRVRAQAWAEAYVFFKHENEARGPAFATRFVQLADRRS